MAVRPEYFVCDFERAVNMNCDVMYKGFDIEVAIIPPAGLVFGDVLMYAQSPRGKHIEADF